MKNFLTSGFLLLVGLLAFASPQTAQAADITVGPGGTYNSIGAAIAAAANGDRILVKPKTIPYGENITINKGLTFLSQDEGTYFNCSGTWTITLANTTQHVTIIGLRLLTGSIISNTAPTGSGRSRVKVLSSVVRDGNINLYNYANFDITVANDSVSNGFVWLRYGKVMGNYISSNNANESLRVFDDNVASTDSVWVVGNRVRGARAASFWTIYLSSATQFIYCVNNHLIVNPINTGADYGIYCDNWKTTGGGFNVIANNTIYSGRNTSPYPAAQYGINLVNITTNSQIVGNVLTGAVNGNGTNIALIQTGANNFVLAYNHLRNLRISAVAGVSLSLNNQTSNVTVDAVTGALTGGTNNAVDTIPLTDPEYTDVDLTAGDAGAYGASFTLSNFHPFVSLTAADNTARVFWMRAPRRVLQGGSLNVQASGYDR